MPHLSAAYKTVCHKQSTRDNKTDKRKAYLKYRVVNILLTNQFEEPPTISSQLQGHF